ncbi:putative protein of unknown function DUF2183 [Phaeomoniella chlamydospora]|uniref:Phosphatidate phosphatase APP1 catalytic domain-containing protein n=1 Tax=Phaeomoniella chlamydospora TaxID=158046 RepID=A0A0G2GBT6_PHACM|nr:putative protein of unknown function DUF2183 [Phaeomoniella chlamydospora]
MASKIAFVATAVLLHAVVAIPAPPADVVVRQERPIITPPPSLVPRDPTKTIKNRRGILSDLTADVDSILSELGSDIPSYVASGVPNFFQGFPSGSAAASSAGVSSSDLDAIPTQVLNVPGYGNWTSSGWNLRIHGNVYKQPNLSNETVDKLANVFLVGTSVEELPASQSSQACNLTREIFVVQQDSKYVTVNIAPAESAGGDGESSGGGGITAPGGNQTITLPYVTTVEGDFDTFVQLQNVSGGGLLAGNGTVAPQRLNVYANGTDTGNATSYLVSETGLTIISDIDDILRITKIYEPKEGLLNSFARPFTQWRNMPDIYRNWSESISTMHFHYLTTTPEQVTRNYMDFIYKTYPGGSFDTRPLNFSDASATLSIRKFLLQKIFQTFPKRKFILVGDTTNSDVMKDYPLMATEFPGQVQCIFLRNTSATDSGDKFPYDTSGFEDLDQEMYMFFKIPDDLANLDIENGKCYNSSIIQNVTFGYQGLPYGVNLGDGNSSSVAVPVVDGNNWRPLLLSSLLVTIGVLALS